MLSTQSGIPVDDSLRPETSKCSRVERTAMNRTQTNFSSDMTKKSVELSQGMRSGAGNSSNETQMTENNMNSSQQGFYQRQNSFSKGMTLEQYFSSTAKSGNFPQPPPLKQENFDDKEVSEDSEYLNENFEIHQEEDEYSESNRDSRLDIEGPSEKEQAVKKAAAAAVAAAKQIEAEREPRFSQIKNSITNENESNRDSNIKKQIREKYTKRTRHQSYNPNSNLLHGNPVMTTSAGVNVGGSSGGGNSHVKSSSMRDTNSNWKQKQQQQQQQQQHQHQQRESLRLVAAAADQEMEDQDDDTRKEKFSKSFYMRKANQSQSPRNQIYIHNNGSKEFTSENSQTSINQQMVTTQYNEKFMNQSIMIEPQKIENYETERSIENHIAFRNSFYSKEFLVKNGILGPFNSSFYNGGSNNSQNRLTNQDFYKNGMISGNCVPSSMINPNRSNDQYEESIMRQTAKENKFLLQKEKINQLIEKEDHNLVNKYAAHFNLKKQECVDLQKSQYGYLKSNGGNSNNSNNNSCINTEIENSVKSKGNKRIQTPNYGFRSQFNGAQFKVDQKETDGKHYKRNDN